MGFTRAVLELPDLNAEADRIAGVAMIEPAPPRAEAMMEAEEPAAQTT